MKRWCFSIGLGVLFLAGILWLSATAVDPMNFIGTWYDYKDETPYLFHNGIIICEKNHISLDENEIFSGAYSFSRNHILLFYMNTNGVEEIRELKLRKSPDGDQLISLDSEDVVFFRKKP